MLKWKKVEDLVFNKCGKCCMECDETFDCLQSCLMVTSIEFDCKDCKYWKEDEC